MSPVSHTTTDNAGSAAENQQVDTTEARIPGTPDETVQGVKSPMLGGTNRLRLGGGVLGDGRCGGVGRDGGAAATGHLDEAFVLQ